jgi:predicted metalloprotease
METEGRRRSSNFEDRGRGAGGGGGGGLPINALLSVARLLGPKGVLIVGALGAVGYLVLPAQLKQQLFGALSGGAQGSGQGAQGSGSVCQASPANGKACDFSRVVLASTEDVWTAQFQGGQLPSYGKQPTGYQHPTLVVFADNVATGGCGNASSGVGPFYCPRDAKLYLDPSFYGVMEQR